MTAKKEPRIFISCQPDCGELAKALAERLDRAGFKILLDRDEIDAGSSKERVIFDKIRSCTHFLPVFSESTLDRFSNSGDSLRRKFDCAVENRKKIIPFFNGVKNSARMPETLRNLQSGLSFQLTRQNLNEVAEKLTSILPALASKSSLTVLSDNFVPMQFPDVSSVPYEENLRGQSVFTSTGKKGFSILPLLLAFLAGVLFFSLFGHQNITIEQNNGHSKENIGVEADDVSYNKHIDFKKSVDDVVVQQAAVAGGNVVIHQQSAVSGTKYANVNGSIVSNSKVIQIQH